MYRNRKQYNVREKSEKNLGKNSQAWIYQQFNLLFLARNKTQTNRLYAHFVLTLTLHQLAVALLRCAIHVATIVTFFSLHRKSIQ
jgi:hypothetical protein